MTTNGNGNRNYQDLVNKSLFVMMMGAFGFGGATLGGSNQPEIIVQLTLPPEFKALTIKLPERIAALESTVAGMSKTVAELNTDVKTLLFERRQP